MRATLPVLLATVTLLGACSSGDGTTADSRPSVPVAVPEQTPAARTPEPSRSVPSPRPSGQPVTTVKFAKPAASGRQPAGITYDTALVPVGASATVDVTTADGKTTVALSVQGVRPDRKFGAHVHTKPCGAKPDASGPHYQNKKDPVTPSVDPAYANPQNEVWLDFATDSKGAGHSSATVDWTFRKDQAHSVVIHAQPTNTHPGHAGTAGDRLACLTVSAF